MVIVDTSIWLQFLRGRDPVVKAEMDRLRASGDMAMAGVVMAELLQGASSQQEFDLLSEGLGTLPFLIEAKDTWIRVGRLSFQLRRTGTPVSLADLLIAALAEEHGCSIYTLDEHFQRIPGLKLHEAGAG